MYINLLKNLHIIKITGPAIVESLTYIVNVSLKTGIFPDRLKIALVKPLYKKGDPTKFENYITNKSSVRVFQNF